MRLRWVVTLLALGCAGVPEPPRDASLLVWPEAVETVQMAGATLRVDAESWRSFQPVAAPLADSLIVVVRVYSTAPLDPDVRIDSVFMRRGASIWSGSAREEQPREAAANRAEFVIRNGPDWAPGDTVDLVATLRVPGGTPVRLRAPRLVILRVD